MFSNSCIIKSVCSQTLLSSNRIVLKQPYPQIFIFLNSIITKSVFSQTAISPDLAVSEVEEYNLDGMRVGSLVKGEIGPKSEIRLDIIWQPNIPGKVDSEFLVTFADPLSEGVSAFSEIEIGKRKCTELMRYSIVVVFFHSPLAEVWRSFSRHSPNWQVVQYFHSPSQKTTGQNYRKGQ
jgi:hypothetical protein